MDSFRDQYRLHSTHGGTPEDLHRVRCSVLRPRRRHLLHDEMQCASLAQATTGINRDGKAKSRIVSEIDDRKLSEKDKREIKKWYADGTFDKYELALIFDVSALVITGIVGAGKAWRTVK